MTRPDRPVTEDDLHAWVDELLSPERLRIVENWLDANPEERQRVMTWRRERNLLRSALDADVQPPVAPRFNNPRRQQSKLRYFNAPQMAASIALALFIGLGEGGSFAIGKFLWGSRQSNRKLQSCMFLERAA